MNNYLESRIDYLQGDNDRLREENENLTKCNLNLQEHIDKVEEENRKLKELLDITVQTKNEKIRNLLEELEYYKKQCGEK